MTPAPHSLRRLAAAAALATACIGAQAATADSPTTQSRGTDQPVAKGQGRQFWQLSDYTTVQLVPREKGSAPNQQPWAVDAETLKRELASVTVMRNGKPASLWGSGELDDVLTTLVEAFGKATPEQDVALVSTARHDDNSFLSISAITARLFFADGHLNLIVRDPRTDFFDRAKGTGQAPSFTVGSRTSAGTADLRSPNGRNSRPDWLVLSTEAAAPAAPAVAAPAVLPTPAAPAAAAPHAAAPAAPVAAPPVAVPAQGDPEKRLELLKRLYDKGLITSDEYQKKRQEILQGL